MAEHAGSGAASITRLLVELGGIRDIEPEIGDLIYRELRRVAAAYMRRERGNHTLEPTALANEAWLRLADAPGIAWQSRSHFFGIASRLMRQILVDHARRRLAGKRGGERRRITLAGNLVANGGDPVDILALDEALHRLSDFDVRASRVVELRFFGGLSFDEAAQILNISPRTAKSDWTMARAWLRNELSKQR